MKNNNSIKIWLCLLIFASMSVPTFAQKTQRNRKPIIFAVLDNGKTLEPIAYIEKGNLTAPVGGDADKKEIISFNNLYYKPKTAYRLIFGGSITGTATVRSSNENSECSRNTAQISVVSSKTKLGGFVMALATDAVAKTNASGLRRKPTAAERTEIESLVRAELTKQKVSPAAIRTLLSQNLTALDVDNDKKADFVGSYWVNTGKTERGLLFFIAEKNSAGKYEFGYSEYRNVKQDEVMSGDIKSVDEGVYHELLLDVFDYDADGVSEIFTFTPAFEGAGFSAFKRDAKGKWTRAFEGSNYHCGY